MSFLSKSDKPRNVEENGSRFWECDIDGAERNIFGDDTTVGVVDENEGGIILYTHESNAPKIIEALQAFTKEI